MLLAEDNDINRAVASRMLRQLDADVLLAENGARAVDVAATETVDLILMDLQMPEMDGFLMKPVGLRDLEALLGRIGPADTRS